MGVVWSARQVVTRQAVALKFLHEHEGDSRARKRFLREARAACAVRHPNVVQIHDVLLVDEETPVIVMELLEGESLAAKLKREPRLGVDEFARLMLPVVSAVGTAHAHGIVHRDLKPDNIFLAKDRGGILVKVLDFGVAKLTATEGAAEKTVGLTDTGGVVGTAYYMSPEQAFGERDVDHRSDIWALGIIFYRCLSGVLPTRGENAGQVLKIIVIDGVAPLANLVPDLPEDILALITQMLSRKREDRPEDLRAVQAVLARHTDINIGAFENAIPPPRSSSQLLDSSDGDSFPSDPSSNDVSKRDLPTRAESLHARVVAGGGSLPPTRGGPPGLLDTAAGSAATLRPGPRRARPRSVVGIVALTGAIFGLGLFGWMVAVRAPDRASTVASPSHAAATTTAAAAVASSPLEPAELPSVTSAPVTAASAQTPPVLEGAVLPPAASTERRSAQGPTPTTRQGKPATAARPASPEPKPSANEIFVAKPPF
jgi:serine/threonine protein kinase